LIWVNDCSGLETTGQARYRSRWTALQIYGMGISEEGVAGCRLPGHWLQNAGVDFYGQYY
jgi:hypothetical protein